MKEISRREFIKSGTILSASAALASCSSKESNDTASKPKIINVVLAYQNQMNFDPYLTTSATCTSTNWYVFEGLYEIDYTSYKPYPALISSDELIKSDNYSYQFKLRNDAKFSTGEKITTDDIISSFDKALGKIDDYKSTPLAQFLSFIIKVERGDDDNFKLYLNNEYDLDFVKSRLSLVKISPSKVSKDNLNSDPIGSGPYKYASIEENKIELEKNVYYTGSKKQLDKLMFSIVMDSDERVNLLRNKQVDACESFPSSRIEKFKSLGFSIDEVQGFNMAYFMFNTKKAPFDKREVRQAFFYAIDIKSIIDEELNGRATMPSCFLPTNHNNYHKSLTTFDYLPDKATELLQGAGASNTNLNLYVSDVSWIRKIAPRIQLNLESVGLNVCLKDLSTTDIFSSLNADKNSFDVVLASGDPTIFGNDASLLLRWYFGDNAWSNNYSGWKGTGQWTEFQSLLKKAESGTSFTVQDSLNSAFDLISEEAVIYPILHRVIPTAYSKDSLPDFRSIGSTGINLL